MMRARVMLVGVIRLHGPHPKKKAPKSWPPNTHLLIFQEQIFGCDFLLRRVFAA